MPSYTHASSEHCLRLSYLSLFLSSLSSSTRILAHSLGTSTSTSPSANSYLIFIKSAAFPQEKRHSNKPKKLAFFLCKPFGSELSFHIKYSFLLIIKKGLVNISEKNCLPSIMFFYYFISSKSHGADGLAIARALRYAISRVRQVFPK